MAIHRALSHQTPGLIFTGNLTLRVVKNRKYIHPSREQIRSINIPNEDTLNNQTIRSNRKDSKEKEHKSRIS